jgi:hypothetical protein
MDRKRELSDREIVHGIVNGDPEAKALGCDRLREARLYEFIQLIMQGTWPKRVGMDSLENLVPAGRGVRRIARWRGTDKWSRATGGRNKWGCFFHGVSGDQPAPAPATVSSQWWQSPTNGSSPAKRGPGGVTYQPGDKTARCPGFCPKSAALIVRNPRFWDRGRDGCEVW